jgi:transcriptional regulator with XRE-family HTH domain
VLNKALKMVRVFNGLSQAALAGQLDISRSYLCEIESGKKKPTLELLEKYKDVFDVPVSSFLLFSERIQSDNKSDNVRLFTADKIMKFLEWVSRDVEVEIESETKCAERL